MLEKKITNFDILKIEQLNEHPKQTEQTLFLEIYLGSEKFKSPNFNFEGRREVELTIEVRTDVFFGTKAEVWIRQAKNRQILVLQTMSFLTYEGHGSIAFNELYNEQNKQRYIRLTLADVTYFGVTYGISYVRETMKEITLEDIERELAEKEEAERQRKLKEEEEAKRKKEQEEAEKQRKLAEEAAKKAKYHPVTRTTRNAYNEPYY